jgi:hypothetical protein
MTYEMTISQVILPGLIYPHDQVSESSEAAVSEENVQEKYLRRTQYSVSLFCFHVEMADCSSIETLTNCEQSEKIHLQMQGQKDENNFLMKVTFESKNFESSTLLSPSLDGALDNPFLSGRVYSILSQI